jgi:pimeloyl-ACP methyl ester carboxylesterase
MLALRALPGLQQSYKQLPSNCLRAFSTTTLSNGITLAYDLHEPTKKADSGLRSLRDNAPPIIFIHGLFGSKKNNRSISKYAQVILHCATEQHAHDVTGLSHAT